MKMWHPKFDKVIVFAVTYVVALGIGMASTRPAEADPTPPPGLHVTRIVYIDSGPWADTGRMIVTLSNHKSDVLKPCRTEDGRHCYWNAQIRGDGRGDSFIVTRGHRFPAPIL